MKSTQSAIDSIVILEPTVFGDARGFFMESFNQRPRMRRANGPGWRRAASTTCGAAVDIRRSSVSFRPWVGIQLSDQNHLQLWLMLGVARSRVATSDGANDAC